MKYYTNDLIIKLCSIPVMRYVILLNSSIATKSKMVAQASFSFVLSGEMILKSAIIWNCRAGSRD